MRLSGLDAETAGAGGLAELHGPRPHEYNERMECPLCNDPMPVLEYEDIEIDCCAECGGIWLDAGELGLLLGDPDLAQGFMSGGDPSLAKGEGARPCPVCDAPMCKGVTGGSPAVVHDNCPRAHGMWFDGGELAAVFRQLQAQTAEPGVWQWLQQLFASRDMTSGQ